ncbi:MAG: hypothetical protein AB7T49_01055 [Oligoflexales bacterium]
MFSLRMMFFAALLGLTSCRTDDATSNIRGGASTGGGDDGLEFSCNTQPTADSAFKIQVLKTRNPKTAVLEKRQGNNRETMNVRRSVTPPGADEAIAYRYEGRSVKLVITTDPDPTPVDGKIYEGRWNDEESLDCIAVP